MVPRWKAVHNFYSRLKLACLDPFLETVIISKIHLTITLSVGLAKRQPTLYIMVYLDHLVHRGYAETTYMYVEAELAM